jgi:hypothetical protein
MNNMKIKRPLAPGFISKLDAWLLLNKPDTWSARTHLVLYYGLIFIALLTLVCFAVPDDPRTATNVFAWSFLISVLAFIGFIVWLIYLLRFNMFKRFGFVAPWDRIKTFLLYMVSVGVMAAAAYVPAVVETIRANKAYTSAEITSDINEMNLAICQLNYDSIPRHWKADTLLRRKYLDRVTPLDAADMAAVADTDMVNTDTAFRGNFYLVDSANFQSRIRSTDSSTRINDSMFIVYECPDYTFVRDFRTASYAVTSILPSSAIYYKVIEHHQPIDKNRLDSQLRELLKKYDTRETAIVYPYDDDYGGDRDYKYRINKKYDLWNTNESLNNITGRKYRWEGSSLKFAWRMFYYTVLLLSLLVFIFRHSTVKAFFLSMLTCIILLMLTGLFMSFVRTGDSGIFICLLIYYLIFLVLACMVYANKTRKLVTGIALNITVFFAVFMPVIGVALYYQLLRNADRERIREVYYFTKYKHEDLHYLYAEITGAVLLLILMETVFKKLYRRWYALPED